MTKTFFLSIIRNLWKNRVTSAINVVALTLGLTSLLFLYVQERYENSFDMDQPMGDQIYRVNLTQNYPNRLLKTGNTQSMLVKSIRNEYPELEAAIQVIGPNFSLVTIDPGSSAEKVFEEDRKMLFADSAFLKYFDYDFIAGNKRTALDDPSSLVLSKRMVKKYYPEFVGKEAGLLGKEVALFDSMRVYITGVIDTPPSNSNTPFQMLTSTEIYYRMNNWDRDNWGNVSAGLTYVVLKEGQRPEDFEARFPQMVDKYRAKDDAEITTYSLINLKDIHGDPQWGFSGNYTNDPSISIAFWALSLFIALSACINFINIQTAQVVTRAKEVGVRKVLGGSRLQLILQFLAETIFLTTISFFLAIWLTELALNGWNDLLSIVQMNMEIDNSVWVFGIGLILFVSLLAGIYPAIKLSAYRPSEALRSGFSALTKNKSGLNLRQALVLTQFSITQLMIIGTIVVSVQMDYFVNKEMGFDKEEMITITTFSPDKRQMDRLSQAMESMPEITSYSFASGPPMDAGRYSTSFREVGHEDKGDIRVRNKWVDHRYLDTYGIELVAGRNFRADEYNDTIDNYIVNETLVKQLEVDSPQEAIGKLLRCYGTQARIIGVTKDFHIDRLNLPIEPMIMFPWRDQVNTANVKVASSNLPKVLKRLEGEWLQVFPSRSFQYETVDDFIKESYIVEDIMLKSIRIFSLVAIIIGCLGLYGLVSFMAVKRTKEIGIRKVLGASFGQILFSFSKRFYVLTFIAFLLSAPLAYQAMTLWLDNYIYRIPLSWDLFAIGLTVTLMLTLITVGYISFRAARTNPAVTLQVE
ncbi:ABC transporter permease [Roseivirga sp. E12]|uniref:ABC transporter permease n=1 Tax=Roseivirga sp. E12 TaxID=2819237 RepID=UPI001ABCEB9C|nr:ABC transporter permease [Roseivirga sp. E12]MBO3697241.1 ABC transporter permease [Roseivirga sp. E12]